MTKRRRETDGSFPGRSLWTQVTYLEVQLAAIPRRRTCERLRVRIKRGHAIAIARNERNPSSSLLPLLSPAPFPLSGTLKLRVDEIGLVSRPHYGALPDINGTLLWQHQLASPSAIMSPVHTLCVRSVHGCVCVCMCVP